MSKLSAERAVPKISYSQKYRTERFPYAVKIDAQRLGDALREDGRSEDFIGTSRINVLPGKDFQLTAGEYKLLQDNINIFTSIIYTLREGNTRNDQEDYMRRRMTSTLVEELQHRSDTYDMKHFFENPKKNLGATAAILAGFPLYLASTFGPWIAWSATGAPHVENFVNGLQVPSVIGLGAQALGFLFNNFAFSAAGLAVAYVIDPAEIRAKTAKRKSQDSPAWQKVLNVTVNE